MRKTLPIIIVGILVLSGLGAVALPEIKTLNPLTIQQTFSCSTPTTKETNNYLTVTIPETTNTLQHPGNPELPLISYSIDLPFGAQNIQVQCTPSNEHTQILDKKIKPTPPPISTNINNNNPQPINEEDPEIYESTTRYPSAWHSARITCG